MPEVKENWLQFENRGILRIFYIINPKEARMKSNKINWYICMYSETTQ